MPKECLRVPRNLTLPDLVPHLPGRHCLPCKCGSALHLLAPSFLWKETQDTSIFSYRHMFLIREIQTCYPPRKNNWVSIGPVFLVCSMYRKPSSMSISNPVTLCATVKRSKATPRRTGLSASQGLMQHLFDSTDCGLSVLEKSN